ncbi:hypothetical protein J1N35_026001 [Gossypium stocksii]|uniref:tRNA-specific adenosine deaminase 1 n=1 Tax=Gossypium stocksii TaxID=47602 RepID=A0A9D3V8Q8_9ROSI|nr:hypothetical protein J1N35_026001 [Gossypium stocksii]
MVILYISLIVICMILVPLLELVPLFSGDCSELIGLVQRKPGRGDTTLSVSCSDKIARWNVVGVQGSRSITCYYIRSLLSFACYMLCFYYHRFWNMDNCSAFMFSFFMILHFVSRLRGSAFILSSTCLPAFCYCRKISLCF